MEWKTIPKGQGDFQRFYHYHYFLTIVDMLSYFFRHDFCRGFFDHRGLVGGRVGGRGGRWDCQISLLSLLENNCFLILAGKVYFPTLDKPNHISDSFLVFYIPKTYMTQNRSGTKSCHFWLENHASFELRTKWRYIIWKYMISPAKSE
jgi:hypothetical protein